jgi:hypothetical protein
MSIQALLNSKGASDMTTYYVMDDLAAVFRAVERIPLLILMGVFLLATLVLRDL